MVIFDKDMLEYEENYYAAKDEKVLRITEFEFAHMSTKEIEKYAYKKLFDFYYNEHTDGELDDLLESLEDE